MNIKETIHLADRSIVLPQIELNYFGPDENGKKPTQPDLNCSECNKQNISVGSARTKANGDLEYICEECSILDFQKMHDFPTLEAAAAYRRRMFDLNYLFLETLLNDYLKTNKIEIDAVDEDEVDTVMTIGRSLYEELPKDVLEDITYLPDLDELKERLNTLIKNENSIARFYEALDFDQKSMEMVDKIMAKLDPEEQAFFMSIFSSAFDDILDESVLDPENLSL